MPNFADYIFNRALNIGLAGVYVGIVNNSSGNPYKAGPTASDGLFSFTAVPAGLYTVYTSPTGSGNPPGGDWAATGETSYVVNPASPVANTDLAGPLLNAITPGSNLSAGAVPGGVGAQTLALVNNPTLSGLLTLQAGLTLTGLLTMLDAASRVVPGATSLSLRNNANNADNLLLSDAGVATIRAGLNVLAGAVSIPDTSLLFRKFQLEANVTRSGPANQAAPGVMTLTNQSQFYPIGNAVTITPAVPSFLIILAMISGYVANIADAFEFRIAVDGAATGSGIFSVQQFDAINAPKTIFLIDGAAVTAAAHTIVTQVADVTNAGRTYTPYLTGPTIFALAIPST